jgi:glycosyltransferase involved in cell wall biosynthesis
MKISVSIATWNRSSLLRKTLESLTELEIPEGVRWELIVVNNGSTDDTDRVIDGFKQRLPVQGLFEPEAGKAKACNKALARASGDCIIWTDDDVVVEKQWLASYAEAFRKWEDAEYFGGPIIPRFEKEPPRWIEESGHLFGALLGTRDFGDEERVLGDNERPYGANMAFRLHSSNPWQFNPNLGPKGGLRLTHEETDLVNAIRSNGGFGVWVPKARVWHFTPQTRLKSREIWKIYHAIGKSDVMVKGVPCGISLFGAPRWLYPELLRRGAAWGWRLLIRHPLWRHRYAMLAEISGKIEECRRRNQKETIQ